MEVPTFRLLRLGTGASRRPRSRRYFRYRPSLRPCAAWFPAARDITERGINHLGQGDGVAVAAPVDEVDDVAVASHLAAALVQHLLHEGPLVLASVVAQPTAAGEADAQAAVAA